MTGRWKSSTRRGRLPADWPIIRQLVLARDGWSCRLRYDCCVGTANQADHIVAGDDHSLDNLQAACEPCHRIKSSREGAAKLPRMARPPEQHPAF